MIRKIAFGALVLAAVLCGTWGYLYLQNLKKPALKPLDILPDSCYLLAEIKDPHGFVNDLTQGNLVWEELLKISDLKEINTVLSQIDSLTGDEDVKEYLGNEPFYAAFYGSGQQACVVYAFNIPDVNDQERSLDFFEKNFLARKISNGFYQCTLKGESHTGFYLYTEAGLTAISENRGIIEKLTTHAVKNPLTLNKGFGAAYATLAKDNRLGIFVHQPYFSANAVANIFSERGAPQILAQPSEKWIPADVGVEPSDINLQGFLQADSMGIYTLIKDQQPSDLGDLYERLPYGVYALEALSINNYSAFFNDSYRGNTASKKADLKKYSDSLSSDTETEMASFAGEFLAQFTVLFEDTSYTIGIAGVSDTQKALGFLKAVSDSELINNDSVNLFLNSDKRMFRLYSAGFFNTDYSYVTVINDAMVFCNSRKGLQEYRRSANSGSSFRQNERAMDFLSRNFNAGLNYLRYADVYKTRKEITAALSNVINRKISTAPELFEKFDATGFSLQQVRGNVFYKAHAGFNPKNKMYQNTLWEALVDTELYRTPSALVNHKTGEKELLAQDKKNQLYLISNTGKILWKRKLEGEMLGKPVQVDYFSNGKLQMMFVTQNNIHLVDRNGNNVEGFPIRIKAGASGGIDVFDYEGNKNYRIWIPLQNNTVICLNNACKAVEGFIPVKIRAPLAGPIKHFLLQQKDYFILEDTTGTVYVTNRKGEARAVIENKIKTPELCLSEGKDISKTALCYFDRSAKTLCKLWLNDKKETIPLKIENEIENYFFDTLGQGNSPQLILSGKNAIQLFDLFGKPISEINWPKESRGSIATLWFGNKKIIVSLASENGTLLMADCKDRKVIENEIRLSDLPASYGLIKGQGNYLVGYDKNKIFCIRP